MAGWAARWAADCAVNWLAKRRVFGEEAGHEAASRLHLRIRLGTGRRSGAPTV
ncbi:hypothetical protein [Faunimonas pinastri]|uniref:hypothetical protein n=1 Tax=Faunimonas pinastri TaxID=1855383 RepID=UPI0015A71CD9|nr:hypothetical protein [Faunimonas pinastri]